jgi:cytochrome c oxidase subunit 4
MSSSESAHGQSAQALSAEAHMEGAVHEHPTWSIYWKVALFLTAITVLEVWLYYVPAFVRSAWFVPILLFLSAVKFGTVVLFYMHLKYDARLFRALFTGPLIIASVTLIALLFLFGKVAIRLGLLT